MIFRSIRWRLQVWHGLLLWVVLTGFGLTAYQLERANRFRQIDRALNERLSELHRGLREGGRDRPPSDDDLSGRSFRNGPPRRRGDFPPPGGFRLSPGVAGLFGTNQSPAYYFVAWNRDGKEMGRSTLAPADVIRPQNLQTNLAPMLRNQGEFREALLATPPGEVLLVGRSIASERASLNRFAGGLLAAGILVLSVGLVGGWFLASRAIRPIETISVTAGRIAAGNLSERIRTDETESELGRLGAVLNDMFARLEDSFAQQRQFTADASHELRTPLAVLLSQLQMTLARERSPQEYRDTLETCQRAGQRMRRLIESLLELARLDAGQETLRRESFDLAQVVRDEIELMAPLAAPRGIQVEAQLNTANCAGDPGRIGQVVTNLLSNAIHYNRENGSIRVSVRVLEGEALLEVEDTGVGISVEDLPHVFERFYRADKSRSHAEGRTGLGLAISQSIVQAHGGRIEVSSSPGQSTTFRVRLPSR